MTVTPLQEANRRKLIAAFEAPENQARQYTGGAYYGRFGSLCASALGREALGTDFIYRATADPDTPLVPWNDKEKLTFAQIGARLRERWGIPT